MVLAQKESIYTHEQVVSREQPKAPKNKKKKNYFFEKIIITMALTVALSFSILVLTRFTSITETKHKVHGLQKQLENLEVEQEKLRVEVEKVSKSKWVEDEAIVRLDMQYPLPEQMIYININPAKVSLLSSEIKKMNTNSTTAQGEESKGFFIIFERLVGYIGI